MKATILRDDRAQPRARSFPGSVCHALLQCSFIGLSLIASRSILVAQTPFAPDFGYADLLRLRSVGDVDTSSDGKQIAYVVSAVDAQKDRATQSLWVVSGADRKTVQIAPSPAGLPAWSPDSRQLAFVGQTGKGDPCISILSGEDLHIAQTFPLPSGPGHLSWSPDGQSIAFSMFVPDPDTPSFLQKAVNESEKDLGEPSGAGRAAPVQLTQSARYRLDGGVWLKPGHSHLFVLSTDTGRLQQVGIEPYEDREPSWMPNGTTLLFTSDRRPESTRSTYTPAIWKADVVTGKAVQLTQARGIYGSPTASIDGQWIAYTENDARPVNYTRNDLYVMRANGTQARRLGPQLDRDVKSPQWAMDSRSLYAQFDDHGVSRVGRFGFDGTVKELASGLDGGFSVSKDGGLAYAASTVSTPAELMWQPAGAKPVTLTVLNAFLQQRQLASLVNLAVRSGADGVSVEGWALVPPGAARSKKLPTILSMHGGPFGSDGPDWSRSFQLYASAGYAVIYANYRGSTSYGTSFSEPADHNFPGLAYDDLMSIVDEAVRLGIADPDRLFITGGSAGGQLTAWIVGKTKRFRAAVAVKPVINEVSEALTTDQYLGAIEFADAPPWKNHEELWAQSPLSLAGSMSTPMLFITGEQDYRTPLDQTLQLYGALQLQRVPTALMRVPGAGHESLASRPSQYAAEIAATLAWFHKYDVPPSQ